MNRNNILFSVLIILAFVSCNSGNPKKESSLEEKDKGNIENSEVDKNVIPHELDTIWYKIFYHEGSFYRMDDVRKIIPFDGNIMLFTLEADEYEEVSEVISTSSGYRITFKQFRFDAEFRFYWVDKERVISKWEYYNNDTNPAVENYSFYAINSLEDYNSLPLFTVNKTQSIGKTQNSIINTKIEESWKINSDNYIRLHIDNDSIFMLPVNSNTMYINVRAKRDKNKYNLYYHSIEDLGRGVKEALDWDHFSIDSIIATIDYDSRLDVIYFNWFGFYNEKTQQRDWAEDSDFQLESGKLKNIQLIRCSDNEY